MSSPTAPTATLVPVGERFLAGAVMLLLVVHVPGFSLVPVSVFPALLLAVPFLYGAPVAVKRLAAATAIALVSGAAVAGVTTSMGNRTSSVAVWGPIVLWVICIPVLVAAAAWSLRRISVRTGVLLMLAGGVVSSAIASLEWKGTLGIFATAFILVLFAGRGFVSFLALGAVLALSATNDARSMALAALASLLVQWILRERRNPRGSVHRAVSIVVIGAVAIGLAVWAMASGLAGQQVQARTLDQLEKSNPLFGVRAEWAATTALAENHPFGFGVGVAPSNSAIGEGILAVRAAGGDWTSHYFSNVVFGERVDLHSTLANLWFHFGIGGIAVAVVIGVILFRGVRDAADSARVFGMGGIFLMLMGIWDLLFSPMADVGRIIAALAVAIAVADLRRKARLAAQLGSEEKKSSPRVTTPKSETATAANRVVGRVAFHSRPM
ncbi:hypothetical protein [Microbacterium testaceum]|uniref:hypothetical protein n=1 Tax=Microbacterium testaceum TaxID=2033 RepID=UPI0024359C28|nr:hypothetical protein [Microbacterium testaceum]